MQKQPDSLDQINQQYQRLRTNSVRSETQTNYPGLPREDLAVKNMYRMQLDEVMRQKQEQKRGERERQARERDEYNQKVRQGREAQRLKDLSYKNYYNMLNTNQNNMVKQYGILNAERDNMKDEHIQRGIQEQRAKNQQWWQAQQKRQQNIKRQYREGLDNQLNEHSNKNQMENQSRVKEIEQFKMVTYTPHEIAKYERDRKLMEMSKYKQDLDKSSPSTNDKYRRMAGQQVLNNNPSSTKNDFNIYQQTAHNPMTNPLPYNIQNPYIRKEMMMRQQNRRQDFIS